MRQRILLIDDEPQMLRQLARVLRERTSYEVKIETNSLEVPRILEEDEFDLIITDLGMPALDGMEILKLVRDKKRFEEVVLITAFGSLGSALEAVSLGVFDYIVKPFRKSQIVATVERAMGRQRRKREDLRLREICAREPYREAQRAFRGEYLKRLKQNLDDNMDELIRRSGLSIDELTEAQADRAPDTSEE